MNIGEKLRRLRLKRNLTQEEMADRCELSKGFISQVERDLAYHNGCAFPFLLAQYCYVSFRMMGSGFIKRAEWLTEGFYEDLSKHGVGAFSELYDGDPPHEAHGVISSAMTTAALLNINWLIAKYREE